MMPFKLFRLTLLLAFALALGIRLYDLTDPPFDFHATRQLRSAIIARGFYYEQWGDAPETQREIAIQQSQREKLLEPPILEELVTLTYHLPGGEALWKARLLSILFWILGGWALFMLAKEMSSTGGALISVLYFLFLPFGMLASRSFQPDPMMVSLILLALWRAYHWQRSRTWRDAVWVGILSGMAILSKAVAIFFVGGALAGLVLLGEFQENTQDGEESKNKFRWKDFQHRLNKRFKDPQTWVVGLFALGPGALYYAYGIFIAGFLQGQAKQSFLPQMWLDPTFYIRWVEMSSGIAGFSVMLIGVAGIWLWRSRTEQAMLGGLWTGYILYSLAFPYHTITHDYYQLPLIAVAALALAPAADLVITQLTMENTPRLARLVLVILAAGAIVFKVWDTRVILARQDFHNEAEEWRKFQDIIPPDKSVMAITKAYGYPLAYFGFVNAAVWPTTSDVALRGLLGQDPEEYRQKQLAGLKGIDLFLVTNFNELERQSLLKEYLQGFEVFSKGSGYIVYDLQKPLETQP